MYSVGVIDVSGPLRSSEVGVQQTYFLKCAVSDHHAGAVYPGFSVSRLEVSASVSEAGVDVAVGSFP